jgi:predicted amidohydrolase YtcJ
VSALDDAHTVSRDLKGRTVVPGFNDAHYHLTIQSDCTQLQFASLEPTWPGVERQISEATKTAQKGSWILGDVGATVFDSPQASRATLDRLAPEHRIALRRWTGHFFVLDSAALRALAIRDDVADPPGGRFVRASGRLTGVALEFAAFDIHRRLSDLAGGDTALRQARAYLEQTRRFGITSVQHMSMPASAERLVSLLSQPGSEVRTRVMELTWG